MVGVSKLGWWRVLERWSSALFLVAGALLVVYATLNGLEAFTDAAFEQKVMEVGYVFAFLGLLGQYPRLADRSPWLARVGAGTAVLGVVAFSLFTVNNLAKLAEVASGDPPGWTALTLFAILGFVVGYSAFGVATLRTGVRSRTVGLLLLVPGIIIAAMLVHIVAGLDSPQTVFVVSAGQAMAHLAIGTTLHTSDRSTEPEEPPDDREVVAHD